MVNFIWNAMQNARVLCLSKRFGWCVFCAFMSALDLHKFTLFIQSIHQTHSIQWKRLNSMYNVLYICSHTQSRCAIDYVLYLWFFVRRKFQMYDLVNLISVCFFHILMRDTVVIIWTQSAQRIDDAVPQKYQSFM